MSSDETVPNGAVVRCQWPGCPSGFTGMPASTGWRKTAVTSTVTLILCPFHAVEHVPSLVPCGTTMTVQCSCREPLRSRPSATHPLRAWYAHAREINGPEDHAVCAECGREFEAQANGLVREHNMLNKAGDRPLATLCPGTGRLPHELVYP